MKTDVILKSRIFLFPAYLIMKLSAFLFILVCQNFSSIVQGAKKASKALLEDISDHKELKKLLKTKNNVLINFIEKSGKSDILSVLKDVAEKVKGSGTIGKLRYSLNFFILKNFWNGIILKLF